MICCGWEKKCNFIAGRKITSKFDLIMNYFKDFLEKEKHSLLQLFFGVIFIILSILMIISKQRGLAELSVWEWLFAVVFFLNGIVNLLEGRGVRVEKYFGKAYLAINQESFQMKRTVFHPVQDIRWQQVQKLEVRLMRFYFYLPERTQKISLYKLPLKEREKVFNVVRDLAEFYNIPFNK